MSEYRNDVGNAAKETRWTFFRFLPIVIIAVIILSVFGFVLKSFGIIGTTIVEREVFEQSYQRSEALNSQLATYEATLAEISSQLSRTDLEPETRQNLLAQKSALNIRINTTKRKMK